MRTLLWVAAMSVVVIASTAAQQDRPAPAPAPPPPGQRGLLGRPSPPQPQQRQGLEYFAGTWKFTWTGRESAITPGPRTGTVTFTRIGDSNFLEMRVEGSSEGSGAYKESGVLGWNDEKKLLAVRERLANGTDILSLGDWTSPIGIRFDTEPIRIQTQTLRLRRSYQILSAASFSVTEELSTNGGPFVRLGTGDFRK
jgi:hypothetical protein